MRTQTTRTIAGRVSAGGAIVSGDGFAVQKGATGVWTIYFPSAFRLRAATVTSEVGGRLAVVAAGSVTGSTFQVNNNVANTLAAEDQPFSFIAVGMAA